MAIQDVKTKDDLVHFLNAVHNHTRVAIKVVEHDGSVWVNWIDRVDLACRDDPFGQGMRGPSAGLLITVQQKGSWSEPAGLDEASGGDE